MTPYTVCPVAGYDLELFYEALEAWAWAQKGYLPEAGGWMDQQNAVLEQIGILNGAYSRWLKTQYKSR